MQNRPFFRGAEKLDENSDELETNDVSSSLAEWLTEEAGWLPKGWLAVLPARVRNTSKSQYFSSGRRVRTMQSGRGLTVWLLVAVVLWSSCGCVFSNVNISSNVVEIPQRQQLLPPGQSQQNILQKYHIPIPYQNRPFIRDESGYFAQNHRKAPFQRYRRRPVSDRFKRNYLKPKRHTLLSLVSLPPHRRQNFYIPSVFSENQPNYIISKEKHALPKQQNPIANNAAFQNVFSPWLSKRSELRAHESNDVTENETNEIFEENNKKRQEAAAGERNDNGQDEINQSLQQVSNSIGRSFFRNARSKPRRWDVPQIGE